MKLRVLLIPAIAGMFLLGACGDDSGSSSSSPATTAAAASGAAGGYAIPSDATASSAAASGGGAAADAGTVVAKDIAYNPTEVTVKVGDTVTFKNDDSFAHTFTANDGQFDSEQRRRRRQLSVQDDRRRHDRVPLQDPLEHEGHDHRHGLRSLFTTLPSAFRGSASMNRTWRGRLYLASLAAHHSRISASLTVSALTT